MKDNLNIRRKKKVKEEEQTKKEEKGKEIKKEEKGKEIKKEEKARLQSETYYNQEIFYSTRMRCR